jgi:hypothetical protein
MVFGVWCVMVFGFWVLGFWVWGVMVLGFGALPHYRVLCQK